MALLETLLQDVDDAELRARLEMEVKRLKDDITFGLVFEKHLPESILLASSVGIRVGDEVRQRSKLGERRRMRVQKITAKKAEVAENGEKPITLDISDLLVVKRFDETVYPTLTSVGSVENGSSDRPAHLVLQSENYHALELLRFSMRGQADVIYIDPPYNTGASDWKYNNDYVDRNDTWRHSKWLSFMEKRLLLAKDLLKPDGVLIVTIDEHEVHHLGLLLERKDLFAAYSRQLVSIVNNPKGVTQGGLSRVEEYAYFVIPAGVVMKGRGDDLLTHHKGEIEEEPIPAGKKPRWQSLLHSGEGARRQDRKRMFYPVFIDEKAGAVIGAGEPLLPIEHEDGTVEWPEPDLDAKVDGKTAVWPVRSDGTWGRWYISHTTLREFVKNGYIALGGYQAKRKTWAFSYLYQSLREQIEAGLLEVVDFDKDRNVVDVRYTDVGERNIKTVWHRSRHDAGAYGADLFAKFVGGRIFPFPKSLYAVRDTLAAATRNRPDALIIDFFAGSGTTLHATCLLNQEDKEQGRRRCILVTNNEVDHAVAKDLFKKGHFPGDKEYEKHGIFEAVTKPRCTAAITGKLGTENVAGEYLDGRLYSEGFQESVEFLRIDYLNRDRVELGEETAALHPLLWLRAGGRGRPPGKIDLKKSFSVVEDAGYAMLFDDAALSDLVAAIADKEIRHVFVFTDYEDAYTEAATTLGATRRTHLLPRDYLEHFRR